MESKSSPYKSIRPNIWKSRKHTPVNDPQEDFGKRDENAEENIKNETLMKNICTLVCCYDTNGNGFIEEGEFKHLMEQLGTRFTVSKQSGGKLNDLIYSMKQGIQVNPKGETRQDEHYNWTTKQIVQILYYFFSEGAEDQIFQEAKQDQQRLKQSKPPQG
jgi:hypothetical protein